MVHWLILLSTLSITTSALAVDWTGNVTEIIKSGRWQIIEFAAEKQLIYRISSDATNSEETHIVFDFVPSKKCEPTPAVMITRYDSYSPDLDEGFVPLAYKLPGRKESMEITKTTMQQGDTFAFFQFKGLTAKPLLQSQDRGNLAIWIPASGDGTVKRSGNIFFSLNGFTVVYEKAQKLCNDNR
jgi:hypothetical protein